MRDTVRQAFAEPKRKTMKIENWNVNGGLTATAAAHSAATTLIRMDECF